MNLDSKANADGEEWEENTKPMVTLTHCGKLGDFVYTWPIAAWFWRTMGRRVHWVLPRGFGPFPAVVSLLWLQEFTGAVTLVDYQVRDYGCGGQPYQFDARAAVARAGGPPVGRDLYHLGLRHYPDQFLTEFQAAEHRLGWAPDWTLNLAMEATGVQGYKRPGEPYGLPLTPLATEHLNFPKAWRRIDLARDVVDNARQLARSEVAAHCYYSGMAVVLYFARVPFTLWMPPGAGALDLYFPDRSRYELKVLEEAVIHPSYREDGPEA